MCLWGGGGGGHLVISAPHYPGIRIKLNGEDHTRRNEERQEQETEEQSISLLYTPCLFKTTFFRGSFGICQVPK